MVSDKQTEVRDDRSYNDVQWVVFENVREKNKYAHRGPFGHQFGQRYVGVIRLGAVLRHRPPSCRSLYYFIGRFHVGHSLVLDKLLC